MVDHMHVESTLGGMALGADGSSWPTTNIGVEVLDAIASLGQTAVAQQTEIDWGTFLKELRFILNALAGGIMEAQVSMICTFLSATAYTTQVDEELASWITEIKGGTAAHTDPAALRQSFVKAAAVHTRIAEAYSAALVGEHIKQRELGEQIIAALRSS